MKIIWDNSESAAPVAPLLLEEENGIEEQGQDFQAEEAKQEKPFSKGFGW